MYIAPFVTFTSGLLFVIQFLACFLFQPYEGKLFCALAPFRCFIGVLALSVLGFAIGVSSLYHAHNPGFPSPWPHDIRKYTHSYAWQMGPTFWIFGFGTLIITTIFDAHFGGAWMRCSSSWEIHVQRMVAFDWLYPLYRWLRVSNNDIRSSHPFLLY